METCVAQVELCFNMGGFYLAAYLATGLTLMILHLVFTKFKLPEVSFILGIAWILIIPAYTVYKVWEYFNDRTRKG